MVQGHIGHRRVLGQLSVKVAAPVSQHHLVGSVDRSTHRHGHIAELPPAPVLVQKLEEVVTVP